MLPGKKNVAMPLRTGASYSYSCDEINIELVFKISQQLEGVRSSPAGFGLLSEGTYLNFKEFEKSF